jgi:hypothetical protein
MAATFQSAIRARMNELLPDRGNSMALTALINDISQLFPEMDLDSVELRIRAIANGETFDVQVKNRTEYVVRL